MRGRIQVLLIEDSANDVDIIGECLSESSSTAFQLTAVSRLAEALVCVREQEPDAVLLDLGLPDARGLEGLQRLCAEAPQLPVVVLTVLDDEETGVKAVQQGAQDYLFKGQVDGNILARTLRYAIERKQMAEELRRHRDHLAELVAKQTEKLAQRNRIHRVLSGVNQAVVHATDECSLLEKACQVLTDEGNYLCAWVMFMEQGEARSIRPVASAGRSDACFQELNMRWASNVYDRGPNGKAAWPQDPIVVRNVGEDADTALWHARARELGCASAIWLPLSSKGGPFGVLGMCATEADAFDSEELALLQELVGDLAYGIMALRTIQERRRAQEEAERAHRTLLALSKAAEMVQEAPTVNDVYAAVGEGIRNLGHQALVMLLDDDGGDLATAYTTIHPGVLEDLEEDSGFNLHRMRRDVAGDELYQQIVEGRRTFFVEDFVESLGNMTTDFSRPPLQEAARRLNLRQALYAPLVAGEEVLGMFIVVGDGLSEADVPAVTTFGNQAATALHKTALLSEMQRLLRQTEAQTRLLQEVMNTVPEGLLLLDDEGRQVLANPQAQEYLNVLTDGISGEPITRLGSMPLSQLLRVARREQRWRELAEPKGERTFEVFTQLLTYDSESRGWLLVLREVTQERRLQAQVQQQDRLAAVGQLAAGIAHDFNNILSVIMLYADLLRRSSNLSAREREKMETITEQARHASTLIRQILDFSRRSVLERAPLDLVPFLKEFGHMLNRTLPESVEISLDLRLNECLVSADPGRLQEALMNLAVNARDAMPEGGRLAIGLNMIEAGGGYSQLPELAAGRWYRISVIDSGQGIRPEHLSHIFEPFFTTKPVGVGTGLGLAQVYGIVKQHDGHIDVISQPGAGTTFNLYLPALIARPQTDPSERSEPLPVGAEATILLVEDNSIVRAATSDLLVLLGCKVIEAANGEEALALYARQGDEIDLVITDLIMPRMGGVELLKRLRAQDPVIPVIAVTGYAGEEDGQSPADAGFAALVAKPLSPNRLAQTLLKTLGGSGGDAIAGGWSQLTDPDRSRRIQTL